MRRRIVKVEVKLGADGHWYCRPYLGTRVDGKQIKPFKSFPDARTREEAQEMAEKWASRITADGKVHSTVLTELLDEYIDIRRANGVSPNTVKTWRTYLKHVDTYLHGRLVGDLSVMDFTVFEQALLRSRDEGGAGLSRTSVAGMHNFLRGAYDHLVKSGICQSNPLYAVAHPRPERHEASAIDEWDFETLDNVLSEILAESPEGISELKRVSCAFAAWLSLVTGARIGEIAALRKRDVVRSGTYIHIGGTVIEQRGKKPWRRDVTKGRKSRNVTITEHDMDVIRTYLGKQEHVLRRANANSPLITIDGNYMRPTSLSRGFRAICNGCGLPKELHFHSLRHTHATWCLSNGVDLKTLSERLGHANEETTLRIYSHVLPGRDAAAATAFEAAVMKLRDGGDD